MYDPLKDILDEMQATIFREIVAQDSYPDITVLQSLHPTDDVAYNEAFDADIARIIGDGRCVLRVVSPESYYATTHVSSFHAPSGSEGKIALEIADLVPSDYLLSDQDVYHLHTLTPAQDATLTEPADFYAQVRKHRRPHDVSVRVRFLVPARFVGQAISIIESLTSDGSLTVQHHWQDVLGTHLRHADYTLISNGSVELERSDVGIERMLEFRIKHVLLSPDTIISRKIVPMSDISHITKQ